MCPMTPEEDLIAWLERCEIPLENQVNIDRFKDYLRDELDITKETQVQALWSAVDYSKVLAEHGIHIIGTREAWGKAPRYGIQGLPGLWGWEAVQEIMEEEE